MKRTLIALFLVLGASNVFAGTITSIAPSMVKVNSGEHFLTIYGTGLGNQVVFDGPAGHFEIFVNASFSGSVVTWVPDALVRSAGFYNLFVRGGTGDSNVVTFEVRGFKFFPFVILVPELLKVQPFSREGAFVKYEVIPIGGDDPNPTVRCSPESGSLFPMGATQVLCTGSNASGEKAEAEFKVLVLDEIAPVLTMPREPIVVKAESREGAIVKYDVSAFDEIWGEVTPECLPRSGDLFYIGVTNVQCTATDSDANVGHGSFAVEVLGEVKPYQLTLFVPDTMYVDALRPEGAEVKYEVNVKGTEDPNPDLTCNPASGSLFPIGTSTVTCAAIDFNGMRGQASFVVEVVDPEYPIIERIVASPEVLKPADGRIVPVAIEVSAFDNFDPKPVCEVFAVTSNQDIDVGDDENPKEYDWKITGPLTLELRAEYERTERWYDIWVGCADFYGNRMVNTVRVLVSPDAGQTTAKTSTKRRAGPKP